MFSETVSTESYALLDSGGDNTQVTKAVAEALGIRDMKSVTIPLASLYQEHTIETTEIFLGIGAINSSRPIVNLPVFTSSTNDCEMPMVPNQMLKSVLQLTFDTLMELKANLDKPSDNISEFALSTNGRTLM